MVRPVYIFVKAEIFDIGSCRIKCFFQTSKAKLLRKIYEKLVVPYLSTSPRSEIEGIMRICYEKKYASLVSRYDLMFIWQNLNCSIVLVPQAFFPATISMAIAKGSPYRELFNYK
jgi:hypothetical protein